MQRPTDAMKTATKAALGTNLFILVLRSQGEKEGRDEVETERGADEDRCQDEACLGDAIRQGQRASLTLGAGAHSRSVNQPVAAPGTGVSPR